MAWDKNGESDLFLVAIRSLVFRLDVTLVVGIKVKESRLTFIYHLSLIHI